MSSFQQKTNFIQILYRKMAPTRENVNGVTNGSIFEEETANFVIPEKKKGDSKHGILIFINL